MRCEKCANNIKNFLKDLNGVGEAARDSNTEMNRIHYLEKIKVTRKLNNKGVFLIKVSISSVAKKLKISEATMHRYIQRVKSS